MARRPREPLPDYGYRLDLNDPVIKELYDRYRRKKGIPVWCPLSDYERHEFELAVIKAMQRREERRKTSER